MCLYVRLCVRMCACVCVRVRLCVRGCVHVCLCVRVCAHTDLGAGIGAPSLAVPSPRGHSPEEQELVVLVGRDAERGRRGGGDSSHLACPLVCPTQPLLKTEPYFAERFSNDTHQVPINSSKW